MSDLLGIPGDVLLFVTFWLLEGGQPLPGSTPDAAAAAADGPGHF